MHLYAINKSSSVARECGERRSAMVKMIRVVSVTMLGTLAMGLWMIGLAAVSGVGCMIGSALVRNPGCDRCEEKGGGQVRAVKGRKGLARTSTWRRIPSARRRGNAIRSMMV